MFLFASLCGGVMETSLSISEFDCTFLTSYTCENMFFLTNVQQFVIFPLNTTNKAVVGTGVLQDQQYVFDHKYKRIEERNNLKFSLKFAIIFDSYWAA